MKHRKLRIAWSVGCAVLCVLLALMWVRSRSVRDSVWYPMTDYGLQVSSLLGRVSIWGIERSSSASQFTPAKVEHRAILDGMFSHLFRESVLGFRVEHEPEHQRVDVPYWFLILGTVALAAASWLNWSNRFSLRALLIAITLASVVLGAVIYWAQ